MKDQQAGDQNYDAETHPQQQGPSGGIAVLLGQVQTCLGNSTYIDDIDALSFSLNQLFQRVDFLYRKALPGLGTTTASMITRDQELSLQDILIRRQRAWRQLQAITRVLNRLEPICHLLSDAIEGIFDSLDAASNVLSFRVGIGNLAHTPAARFAQERGRGYGYVIPTEPIDDKRWDSALNVVFQSLKGWQQSYRTCIPFSTQFSELNEAAGGLAIPEKDHAQEACLDRLDAAFATLLDSACIIFGDILPAFRTSAANDHESTDNLLFDLIQQSDHLLLQLDATLEFLDGLIEDFTLGPEPAISDESTQQ